MNNFVVKINFEISNIDYKIIRTLYQPIVGIKPCAILMYLYDFTINNDNEFIVKNILDFFNITNEEFKDYKKKLESFCLIKTFRSKIKNDLFIIKIEKPFNIEAFNKNVIYKNNLIQKIGKNNYNIIFDNWNKKFSYDEFDDISTKYIDYYKNEIFVNLKNNEPDKNIQIIHKISNSLEDKIFTNELELPKVSNSLEAISIYSTTQFIKYIKQDSATLAESQWVSQQNNSGFSDETLNLIIKSCTDIINRYSFSYIKTVVSNLKTDNKILYEKVQKHFSNIKTLKTKAFKAFKKNKIEPISIFDLEDEKYVNFEDVIDKSFLIKDFDEK